MEWRVLIHDEFEPEFDALPVAVADELLAHAKLLAAFGPRLGRPHVDTLKRFHPRQHEGVAFRCGGRRLARCICL